MMPQQQVQIPKHKRDEIIKKWKEKIMENIC